LLLVWFFGFYIDDQLLKQVHKHGMANHHQNSSSTDPHDPAREYEAAGENIRYIGNICVAEVTIFIAVTGALLTAILNLDEKHNLLTCPLKVLGICTSIYFIIIMVSTRIILFHCTKRAVFLEKALKYALWSTLPDSTKFWNRPHFWAHVFLGVSVCLFWVWYLSHPYNASLKV
jgi:hypothetical protein